MVISMGCSAQEKPAMNKALVHYTTNYAIMQWIMQ